MATKTSADVRRLARNEVITARRMTAAGWTRGEIRSLVRRELVFPAHAGVFFLGAEPSRLAVWTAAVARCGGRALLSHWSAAALWWLVREDAGRPHVLLQRGARRVTGIQVHATTRPAERCVRRLVPVTSLARTIEDCAMTATPERIKALLRQAEYHHDLDLTTLTATRSRRLKAVLTHYIPGQGKTDSELEAAFYELAHRAGLPRPLLQRHVPGGRADFLFAELRLIVEVDGYQAHKGRIAFTEDRARDRANRRRGYDTVRFTWGDVQLAADAVVDDLANEASRRSTVSSTKS